MEIFYKEVEEKRKGPKKKAANGPGILNKRKYLTWTNNTNNVDMFLSVVRGGKVFAVDQK